MLCQLGCRSEAISRQFLSTSCPVLLPLSVARTVPLGSPAGSDAVLGTRTGCYRQAAPRSTGDTARPPPSGGKRRPEHRLPRRGSGESGTGSAGLTEPINKPQVPLGPETPWGLSKAAPWKAPRGVAAFAQPALQGRPHPAEDTSSLTPKALPSRGPEDGGAQHPQARQHPPCAPRGLKPWRRRGCPTSVCASVMARNLPLLQGHCGCLGAIPVGTQVRGGQRRRAGGLDFSRDCLVTGRVQLALPESQPNVSLPTGTSAVGDPTRQCPTSGLESPPTARKLCHQPRTAPGSTPRHPRLHGTGCCHGNAGERRGTPNSLPWTPPHDGNAKGRPRNTPPGFHQACPTGANRQVQTNQAETVPRPRTSSAAGQDVAAAGLGAGDQPGSSSPAACPHPAPPLSTLTLTRMGPLWCHGAPRPRCVRSPEGVLPSGAGMQPPSALAHGK